MLYLPGDNTRAQQGALGRWSTMRSALQGSGWGWLAAKPMTGQLHVVTTANQDTVEHSHPVRTPQVCALRKAIAGQPATYAVLAGLLRQQADSWPARACAAVPEPGSPCLWLKRSSRPDQCKPFAAESASPILQGRLLSACLHFCLIGSHGLPVVYLLSAR